MLYKQKTANEVRISDWSADVCSSERLESNQAFLLSMLESGAEAEADIAAIEQRLKDNKTEEVRVAVASGGLREKLQRFEGDLHEIASRNVELRSEVDAMRDRKSTRLNSSH